jgi:hypothetical protein
VQRTARNLVYEIAVRVSRHAAPRYGGPPLEDDASFAAEMSQRLRKEVELLKTTLSWFPAAEDVTVVVILGLFDFEGCGFPEVAQDIPAHWTELVFRLAEAGRGLKRMHLARKILMWHVPRAPFPPPGGE